MITQTESIVHLCASAAMSTAMLGVGFGALGVTRRATTRVRWPWLIGGGLATAMTLFVANVELRFDPTGGLLPAAFGAIAGLVIGVPLAIGGLRGRFVGDHPHCRRCGFDLTGRPDSSTVCGECGTDLTDPAAITLGVRQRRPMPLLAGAFLAILSLSIGVAFTRQTLVRSGGLSVVRYEPTSWLIADLAKGKPVEQAEAAAELQRRLLANALDAQAATAFVKAATTNLAARPWLATIGPTSAAFAWDIGRLDESTMRGVIRTTISPTLTLSPQSLPARVPFEITMYGLGRLLPPRGGELPTVQISDRVDTINDVTVQPDAIAGATLAADPMTLGFTLAFRPLAGQTPFGRLYVLDRQPLPAGTATVRMQMTVTVTLAGGPTRLTESVPVTLAGTTMIVPGLVRPLPSMGGVDPMLRPTATVYRNWTPAGTRTFVTVAIPSAVSFIGDASARQADGTEYPLGPLAIDRGFGELSITATLPDDAAMTLVLRPAPERGVDYVRPIATYQHDIVIEAARIEWLDRATRQKR